MSESRADSGPVSWASMFEHDDRPITYPKRPYFCEHFITPAELGSTDEWCGTYCKLPNGHDGPHSALYADERGDVASPSSRARTEDNDG